MAALSSVAVTKNAKVIPTVVTADGQHDEEGLSYHVGHSHDMPPGGDINEYVL